MLYKKICDEVYRYYQLRDGKYFDEKNGKRSYSKSDFKIEYKTQGGKTTIENLYLSYQGQASTPPSIPPSNNNFQALNSTPLAPTNTNSANIINGGNIPDTNLTWTFDAAGTLTISGNGDMTNYYGLLKNRPWNNEKALIQKVVIKKGVTSLGNCAFCCFTFNMSRLKEVTISDSVKKIGGRTFQYCDSLKNVELPDSIEEIGECAFRGCSHLESINFSRAQNLKQIDDHAFRDCRVLKEVILPPSLQKIGDNVFAKCESLEVIKYPRGLQDAHKLGEDNNAALIPY